MQIREKGLAKQLPRLLLLVAGRESTMYEFSFNLSFKLILLQKAHARLRVLNLSTTLSSSDKEKIRPVLKADFMSSDESDSGVNNTARSRPDLEESSDSDDDSLQPAGPQRKQLIRHPLPWRSKELQLTIESLDRKIGRRRTDRAKAMCLDIVQGSDSNRPVPENSPEWAIELFS